MNYKLSFINTRTLFILLSIILSGIILINMFNLLNVQESFGSWTYDNIPNSKLNYSIGKGVVSSWENKKCNCNNCNNNNNNCNNNKINDYDTLDIRCSSRGEEPLPTSDLFMFNNTPFGADCCQLLNLESNIINVSGSNGCACINQQQIDLINKRGGNRIYPNIY